MTDDFERLADAYAVRESASLSSRLALLMEIERVRDRRVLPFLLGVLRDDSEADQVRIYVLKQLRHGNGLLMPADRPPAARAVTDIIAGRSSTEVRLQAALALGVFTQIPGVLSQLGTVCVAPGESIDLRYAAFTSLERAGPTPDCIALLRQISNDETLGGSARSVLSAWHAR